VWASGTSCIDIDAGFCRRRNGLDARPIGRVQEGDAGHDGGLLAAGVLTPPRREALDLRLT